MAMLSRIQLSSFDMSFHSTVLRLIHLLGHTIGNSRPCSLWCDALARALKHTTTQFSSHQRCDGYNVLVATNATFGNSPIEKESDIGQGHH